MIKFDLTMCKVGGKLSILFQARHYLTNGVWLAIKLALGERMPILPRWEARDLPTPWPSPPGFNPGAAYSAPAQGTRTPPPWRTTGSMWRCSTRGWGCPVWKFRPGQQNTHTHTC